MGKTTLILVALTPRLLVLAVLSAFSPAVTGRLVPWPPR